jgi:integrase
VFERAKAFELVEDNPASVIGKVRKVSPKINFWTKEEFEKMIAIINIEDYYEHFIYVCLWLLFMSGMRIGEASALQWSDLNFETGVLIINKSLYYQNSNKYEFTSTKTVSSNRNIVLDKDTLDVLKEWKARQVKIINCGFILSYTGIPLNNSSINQFIKRYSPKAGVHVVSVHGLRHSHASLLIQLGENPLVVRDRLGHKDVETTLAIYSHLYPKTNVEVASKLQGVIQR